MDVQAPSSSTAFKPWLEGCLSSVQLSWALNWVNGPYLSVNRHNDFADHVLLMFLRLKKKKKKSLKSRESLLNVSIYKPKWIWALQRSSPPSPSTNCVFLVSLWISFHFVEQLSCCPEGPQILCSALEPVTQVLLRKCALQVVQCCLKQEPRGCCDTSAAPRQQLVFSYELSSQCCYGPQCEKNQVKQLCPEDLLLTGNLASDKPLPRLHPAQWLRTGALV